MKNELIEKVLVDRNDYVNILRSGYTCDYTLLAESDQVPAYKRPTGFALVDRPGRPAGLQIRLQAAHGCKLKVWC